ARNSPPGKTIVVGLTHTHLEEMIRLARRAEELGVHGGLVPCPFYFPNSFAMVLEFFKALDRGSNLDLILYDNPLYTKTFLRTQEITRLVEGCVHLKAVKMTDHELEKITALKQDRNVIVFCGDDVVAFRSLLLGVDGSMIIAPAIFPQAYQKTARLVQENQS